MTRWRCVWLLMMLIMLLMMMLMVLLLMVVLLMVLIVVLVAILMQVIGEWKLKVEDLCSELEASQRECRSSSNFQTLKCSAINHNRLLSLHN